MLSDDWTTWREFRRRVLESRGDHCSMSIEPFSLSSSLLKLMGMAQC